MDDPNYLPPFAKQWLAQWESAGPRLQAIRDRELRELDQSERDQNERSSDGPDRRETNKQTSPRIEKLTP